jgi:hypothetical protein
MNDMNKNMHFYKINWYNERKDYLTFTENIAPEGTSFKTGPEKYLTDEMNKRELSSYLGPEGKGKGKGGKSNKRKNNKRKSNKRKNKTKKSYRKSKIRKNKRTRR